MLNLKNELIALNKFKDNTISNFKNVRTDVIHQEEMINNFVSKVNFSLSELENKIKSYEENIKAQNDNFNNVRNEIFGHIDVIDSKLNSKLKEINDIIFKQSSMQCKELDNFENHILTEHDKFTKYIQNRYDEQNENMKKLFSTISNEKKYSYDDYVPGCGNYTSTGTAKRNF